MMSSFTTLKKNSRFKSACPSSGPVTFCEGGPGHVHARSPRVSHAASCTNLVQESIVALHRLVPHPVLPPSVGIFAAARPTVLGGAASGSVGTKHFLGPPLPLWVFTGGTSGSVGTKHFLGPHCLWVFTFRQDASAAASTDTAPATSAGAFSWLSRISSNFH